MEQFTRDEINLLCIYDVSKREGLILNLTNVQKELGEEDGELRQLMDSALAKLHAMSDEEYDAISGELVPDWEA